MVKANKTMKKGEKAAVQQADSSSHVDTVNADHYSKLQEAMNIIDSVPELSNICGHQCIGALKDGGSIAPFNAKAFRAKMSAGESYLCGHNLFLSNPPRDASPGVPIDSNEITIMRQHFFANVFEIKKLPTIEIAVDGNPEGVDDTNCQRVSPCEPIHALIFM